MHLETFTGYRASADLEAADEEFAKAKRCLPDAVVEMRRMVSELGPLLLEDVGLVEASRRLLSDIAERTGWEVEFESEGPDDRLTVSRRRPSSGSSRKRWPTPPSTPARRR